MASVQVKGPIPSGSDNYYKYLIWYEDGDRHQQYLGPADGKDDTSVPEEVDIEGLKTDLGIEVKEPRDEIEKEFYKGMNDSQKEKIEGINKGVNNIVHQSDKPVDFDISVEDISNSDDCRVLIKSDNPLNWEKFEVRMGPRGGFKSMAAHPEDWRDDEEEIDKWSGDNWDDFWVYIEKEFFRM